MGLIAVVLEAARPKFKYGEWLAKALTYGQKSQAFLAVVH
jgi:hypothetical protein